jgi:hypothetical protein
VPQYVPERRYTFTEIWDRNYKDAMAFITVPDTAMLELIYSYQGQHMENTLYYSGDNVSDASVLNTLCNSAISAWGATFKLRQTNQISLIAIKATDLTSDSGATAEIPVTEDNSGDDTTPGLPGNDAVVMSLKTAKRGRSYRGRLYIPGVPTNAQTASVVSLAWTAAAEAWYSEWDFLDVGGEPYAQMVVSRYHAGAPRVVGIAEQVTAWVCNPIMASQRRRLPGRGI